MQIVFNHMEIDKIHEILERELLDLRVGIRHADAPDYKKRIYEEEILLTILHKKFAVAALFAPRAVERFEQSTIIE